jgi:hypothetical protein
MAQKRDEKRTQAFIDEAIAKGASQGTAEERNRHAWAYLRSMRRLGDDPLAQSLNIIVPRVDSAPQDLDLADAEHYMYARFLASSTGDPLTNELVMGYELVKTLRYATGREKDLRTDSRFPVLPPSTDSVRWGLKGAGTGLQEYQLSHGGKNGKLGSAIQSNQQFAESQYKNAYAQPYSKAPQTP